MRIWSFIVSAAIAFSLGAATPDLANAKDKKGKKNVPKGQIERHKGGAAKSIPPGQIKRYTRGSKLPSDLRWDDIGDLSKWKLDPLKKGEKYIKVDNEILKVNDDLDTVIDAVGIVDDLLK